jgi:hypothetical protein
MGKQRPAQVPELSGLCACRSERVQQACRSSLHLTLLCRLPTTATSEHLLT